MPEYVHTVNFNMNYSRPLSECREEAGLAGTKAVIGTDVKIRQVWGKGKYQRWGGGVGGGGCGGSRSGVRQKYRD